MRLRIILELLEALRDESYGVYLYHNGLLTLHVVSHDVPRRAAGVDRKHVLEPGDLRRRISGGLAEELRVLSDLDRSVGGRRSSYLRKSRRKLIGWNKENVDNSSGPHGAVLVHSFAQCVPR